MKAPAVRGFEPREARAGRNEMSRSIRSNRGLRTRESPAAANFRGALAEMTDRIYAPSAEQEPRQSVELPDLRDKILTAINPKKTIPTALNVRVGMASPADWDLDKQPCEPVMAVPEFEQPMYEPLRDLSQEWLLPGVGDIPPNTVSLLEINQRFIECYMAGLNHEMARELLWHEYPTDQRGTYFRQFWDVRGYIDQQDAEKLKDIKLIPDWGNTELGTNTNRETPPDGHLVLLIRGELLRRYPNTIVYANRTALDGDGKRTLGDEQRYPVFHGTLNLDIFFIGFDLSRDEVEGDEESTRPEDQGWYFVLEEQPTEPRFGLEVNSLGGVLGNWSDFSWGHLVNESGDLENMTYIDLDPDPENDLPSLGPALLPDAVPPHVAQLAWHARHGSRASDIAYITLQSPFRVAIHGSDMLPPR